MLEHLHRKIKQIATSLQRWNLYHQNTKNTTTYSKNLKKVFHEIVLEATGKLATGIIYNINEKKNGNSSGIMTLFA